MPADRPPGRHPASHFPRNGRTVDAGGTREARVLLKKGREASNPEVPIAVSCDVTYSFILSHGITCSRSSSARLLAINSQPRN